MKKIFAIIMMVIMVFSMSVTAFAEFIPAPKEPELETVTVKVTLKDGYTSIGKTEEFERYKVEVGKPDEVIKGRIFELDFTITNNTKHIIYADEVLEGFKISVTENGTEKTVDCWTKAEDSGFGKTDLNFAINRGKDKYIVFTYKIYAITDKSVTIKAIYREEAKDVEKDATFTLIAAPVETTTVTTTSTTASTAESTESKNTEAEVPTTEETYTTEIPATVSEVDDYDYVAPIEDEIPATGSNSVALTAFGALGITAIAAAIVTKKKKH